MSNEAIQELKTIFLEEYGAHLSEEEAEIAGNSLVTFFESLRKIEERRLNENNN